MEALDIVKRLDYNEVEERFCCVHYNPRLTWWDYQEADDAFAGISRWVDCAAAYDRPNRGGICNAIMLFHLRGPEGALSLQIRTDWYLNRTLDRTQGAIRSKAGGFWLICHSPYPLESDDAHRDYCDVIGGECYSSDSALESEKYFTILVEQGMDALWIALEEYYDEVFFGGEKDEHP